MGRREEGRGRKEEERKCGKGRQVGRKAGRQADWEVGEEGGR